MDLKRTITAFVLHLSADGYSQTTQDLYGWALKLLCSYLDNPEISAIKPTDLDRFWSWLRNDYKPKRMNGKTDPLAGRSLENVWTAERTFFAWCQTTGKIKKRPDLNIRKPEYAEREIQPFTLDEVKRMLEAAQRTRIAATERRTPFTMPRATAKRDTALIMILADTGMRVSECARLLRSDIDFDVRELTIRAFGTGRKTKERTLEIGKQTVLALWEYVLWREAGEQQDLADDDLIFRTLAGNPMNKDSIRQVITEIGLAAGVENAHPHRFRHFYTSEMAADDMAEENLMYNLGQTSGKMVRRYTHLHRRRRRQHISPVDKLKKK
ncbi:MAG TPA: tyrosine-type recombinase/integrase [Anaerolineaceae bacterium]|nr:tyrosine-type recombinase/integrase [Anaerolineaceae bacterium]